MTSQKKIEFPRSFRVGEIVEHLRSSVDNPTMTDGIANNIANQLDASDISGQDGIVMIGRSREALYRIIATATHQASPLFEAVRSSLEPIVVDTARADDLALSPQDVAKGLEYTLAQADSRWIRSTFLPTRAQDMLPIIQEVAEREKRQDGGLTAGKFSGDIVRDDLLARRLAEKFGYSTNVAVAAVKDFFSAYRLDAESPITKPAPTPAPLVIAKASAIDLSALESEILETARFLGMSGQSRISPMDQRELAVFLLRVRQGSQAAIGPVVAFFRRAQAIRTESGDIITLPTLSTTLERLRQNFPEGTRPNDWVYRQLEEFSTTVMSFVVKNFGRGEQIFSQTQVAAAEAEIAAAHQQGCLARAAWGNAVATRAVAAAPNFLTSVASLGQWLENQGMAFGPFYGRPFLLGSVAVGGAAAAMAGAAYYLSRD